MLFLQRFLIFSLLLISLSLEAKSVAPIVLIDPGHGGEEDHGAASPEKKPLYEKDLALKVALQVYEFLNVKKNVRAYLTRSGDYEVKLNERVKKSLTLNADVLVSIHLNSSVEFQSNGFEIFYLGRQKDAYISGLEAKENGAFGFEEGDLKDIFLDIVWKNNQLYSKALGQSILHKMKPFFKKYKIRNRGLKSGLFYILATSKIPSVIVELGFLSNKKDRAKMTNPRVQKAYARAIASGIESYIQRDQANIFF